MAAANYQNKVHMWWHIRLYLFSYSKTYLLGPVCSRLMFTQMPQTISSSHHQRCFDLKATQCDFLSSTWQIVSEHAQCPSAQAHLCFFFPHPQNQPVVYTATITEQTLVTVQVSPLARPQTILNSELFFSYTDCLAQLESLVCSVI